MNPLESFEIDHGDGLPVWLQLKNRLAFLIASGEYKAEERLPTVRALAVDLDISYNTVNRAYMDLEREGYLTTRKGRGTFVAEIEDKGILAVDDTVWALADEYIRAATAAGMDDEAIIAFAQSRLNDKDKKEKNTQRTLSGKK